MPRSIPDLLNDILEYAGKCRNLAAGKTYLTYANDERLRLAVERCISVIGEALTQALKIDPGLSSAFPDAVRIVNLRHRIVHAYFDLSSAILWGVVQDHLSDLEAEVRNVLLDWPDAGTEEETE